MADGRILLTGATGNVGPHLLASLLQRGDEGVVCLVRASSEEAGLSRVTRALQSAGYDASRLAQRITAIPGDLALPRFGLSESAWSALSTGVRQVVHNAAWLGQRERFSAEALTNITGTTAVVDLCLRAGARLDHVSSIGVLKWTLEDEDGTLPECVLTASPEPPEDDTGQHAYYFSKWMAEQVAIYAGECVPVTVHRLGDVFSHTADAPLTAAVNAVNTLRSLPDDGLLSWVQHSISDLFAGQSIAAIARHPSDRLRIMHDISYVHGASVADMRRAFAERGVTLRSVPIDEWMAAMRRDVPWLGWMSPWLVDYLVVPKRPVPRFLNPAFMACLEECGVAIPTIAERLAPVVAAAVGEG
jgi:thioester reductase-like protein